MTILAIDIGTSTGWAIQYDDGRIESGYVSFKPNKNESKLLRFAKFNKWLECNFKNVDKIYYEMVRGHAGVHAAHMYGGFLAFLGVWCNENKIPMDYIEVKTLKKFATGNGNAGKPEMIAAAIAAGFNVSNDDEADAIHLLRYAIEREKLFSIKCSIIFE